MNKEANYKVYDLNQQAMKYLETLALLYANFEQICTGKREIEEQFDRDFDNSLKRLSESRALCVKVAATYAGIEADLNEGLGVVRSQFNDTAAATLSLSLSCGTNDHDNNEVLYLQETLVDSLLAREYHDDGFEEWRICVTGSERQAEATQADVRRQCLALLLLRGSVFYSVVMLPRLGHRE